VRSRAGATIHGLGSGTDRSAPWALGMYATAVSTVSAAIVWRAARGRVRLWTVTAAGLTAAAAVLLVVELGTGPLHFRPRPWNAASFSEQLSGRITQLNGVSRGIVSMVGQGQGLQNVLVRADLLITPLKLLKTSFQMEYLPSGELCTGRVTKVHPTAFTAICRLPTGEERKVSAQWQANGSADIAGGLITASSF
jgi:hypothetical protein